MGKPRILLDAKTFRENLNVLRPILGSRLLFPVIKANAYGHGMELMAQSLEKEFSEKQAPYFCVARLSEAQRLREALPKSRRILVLSSPWECESLDDLPQGVDFVFSDLEDFARLKSLFSDEHKNRLVDFGIHLKWNTGMNRLGFAKENLEDVYREIPKWVAKGVRVRGILSHLARGEEKPQLCSLEQGEKFLKLVQKLKSVWSPQAGPFPEYIHLENSGGLLQGLGKHFPELNVVRPGLCLYGLYGDPHDRSEMKVPLKPFLFTEIPFRKIYTIEAGDQVGYGATYVAKKKMTIGIVNLGYADGLLRALSRREGDPWTLGMSVNGKLCPFVGRISMDMSCLDLSEVPDAQNQKFAQWIGPTQSAEKIGHGIGSISYEVICALSSRMERVWVNDV